MRALLRSLMQLGEIIPMWVVIASSILLLPFAAKTWLYTIRSKQVRSQVRRVAQTRTHEERQAQEDVALQMAQDNPRLIVTLADNAFRLNQRRLGEKALESLEGTGKYPEDIKRLRTLYMPSGPPTPIHPIQAAANIRKAFAAGMYDAARIQLTEALRKFPQDDTLQKFERRFDRAVTKAKADADVRDVKPPRAEVSASEQTLMPSEAPQTAQEPP